MNSLKKRIELLELEIRFRKWLRFARFLERLSKEQLYEYACLGRLPEPLPEPLPKGASKLDGLSRKRLIELWKEEIRIYAGRSTQELMFFSGHGHWPEQVCREQNCGKPASGGILSSYGAREGSMPE